MVGARDQLSGLVLDDKYELSEGKQISNRAWLCVGMHLELNRPVDVRLWKPTSPGEWERFREATLLASQINHPNAAALLELGRHEDFYYLVSENMISEPLANAGPLRASTVVDLGIELLGVLEEAHAMGIAHGSISKDTVHASCSDEGELSLIKISDFCIAPFFAQTPIAIPPIDRPERFADDVTSMAKLLISLLDAKTTTGKVDPTIRGELARALEASSGDKPTASQLRRELLSASDGGQTCPACSSPATKRQKFCASCGLRLSDSLELQPQRRAPRGTYVPPTPREVTMDALRLTTRITVSEICSPLVGRMKEIERVSRFCDGESNSHCLALVGPAGVGKGRIIRECYDHKRGSVAMFVTGADPTNTKRPWNPIASLCQSILGVAEVSTLTGVRNALERIGLTQRDALPLAEIMGVQTPHTELELAVRRRECAAAVKRLLHSVSRRFPRSVLVFVDIDQYDEPSRRLVADLSERDSKYDTRMILTTSSVHDLSGDCQIMNIKPLGDTDAVDLLFRLCGIMLEPQEVMELTKGIPQAIEQVAGWLSLGNGTNHIPPEFVELLSARIEQLPVVPRRIIQATALHGSYAPYELVSQTLGVQELPVVDPMLWEGLVTDDGGGFTIMSPLIAKVAVDTIPIELRRRYHARAYRAMQGSSSNGLLASHAEQAGNLELAYRHYVAAGDDASNRFDDHCASEMLSKAVDCARRLTSIGEKMASDWLVEASVKLAFILRIAGHPSLASGVVEEASMFIETRSHRAYLARARSGIHLARGHSAMAAKEAREAIELATEGKDWQLVCYAFLDLAAALDREGNTSGATDELSDAISLITVEVEDDLPPMLWHLALRLAERLHRSGRAEESIPIAKLALESARVTLSRRGEARCAELLADIFEELERPHIAEQYQAMALRELTRLGDRRTVAQLLMRKAKQGKPERRQKTLEIVRALATEIGWRKGMVAGRY